MSNATRPKKNPKSTIYPTTNLYYSLLSLCSADAWLGHLKRSQTPINFKFIWTIISNNNFFYVK